MMSSSHLVPVEYCGKRVNTVHSYTTDLVFRCCGEKVPTYLHKSGSSSAGTLLPVVKSSREKAKSKVLPTPETIIISSPTTSPIASPAKNMVVKTGQFSSREIVELYRTGSITRGITEKIRKDSSSYGLVSALSIPAASELVKKKVLARDSRKIVVFVGSSSDKWAAFKNLGNCY